MQQPHENIALAFAQAMVENQFAEAHQLMSTSAQQTLTVVDLEKKYANMAAYFSQPANHVEVIEALSDWPGKLAGDVAWVYVSIDNGSQAEAVSVTLEQVINSAANEILIREIIWGRP